jgi:hypothetical protein
MPELNFQRELEKWLHEKGPVMGRLHKAPNEFSQHFSKVD